jgi:hypothetical protein
MNMGAPINGTRNWLANGWGKATGNSVRDKKSARMLSHGA